MNTSSIPNQGIYRKCPRSPYISTIWIRHAYIERGTPQLNGKVERSHRSDQQEFYQLLSYKGDFDLEAKLDEWERFYNFARPHGAHNGQTPYEALRDKLQ
jgi:transposase InsO family protein